MTMDMKKMTGILALILLAVLSFTKLSAIASDPSMPLNQHSIEQADNNISTVMKLSAGTAAASVALTLLPSDVGTPIAEQLADMSKYFLVILSAIYLEKYLITVTGWFACKLLVPIACGLFIGFMLSKKEVLFRTAVKTLACAVLIFAVIPTSVAITDIIYQTQESSINSTIDELENFEVTEEESSSILNKITSALTGAEERATTLFTNLIDTMAVMLATSCLIPVLVILFYIMLVKMLFHNQTIRIDESAIKKLISREKNE